MCRTIISVPDTCGLIINVILFYNLMRDTHLEIITEDPGVFLGFPGGSDSKESACNAGDPGLIPGWGRSPGEGNGNPTQYACLENPMDRGAWKSTVHGVARARHYLATKPPPVFHLWQEKGTAEDEMVEWHHQLYGHEFEQAPGVAEGLRSLASCRPPGPKESDTSEQLN